MNGPADCGHVHNDDRLAQLTARARELAGDVIGPLRRISVQLDGAGVELEWEDGARSTTETTRPPGILALAPLPATDLPGEDDLGSEADLAAGVVRSPVVGTFYRASAPGEPPFVAVGGTVEPDTVVGIVEAMKLMNRIVAGQHGVVRSVLPADGSPVEFDQPLVLLDAADDPGPGHGEGAP